MLGLVLIAQAEAPAVAPIDPGALLTAFIEAIRDGNWPLAAAVGVFALVLLARTIGPTLHPWFASRRAAVVLAVGFAAASAIAVPMLGGAPWSVALLGQALTAALAAMGAAGALGALRKGGTSETMAKRVRAKRDVGTVGRSVPPGDKP